MCLYFIFQILKWAEKEVSRQNLEYGRETLRNITENVVEHIRFPLMDQHFLLTIVKNSRILSAVELLNILSTISQISHNETSDIVTRFSSKPRISQEVPKTEKKRKRKISTSSTESDPSFFI